MKGGDVDGGIPFPSVATRPEERPELVKKADGAGALPSPGCPLPAAGLLPPRPRAPPAPRERARDQVGSGQNGVHGVGCDGCQRR